MPVRSIDWQSRAVWLIAILIAAALGVAGGVACALADPLLTRPWLAGRNLAGPLWILLAVVIAYGFGLALARRWRTRFPVAGDVSALIISGRRDTAAARPAYFIMMGLWVLVAFAAGSAVLAAFDLFTVLASAPLSRALVLGGFAILGVPLLLWILGERAQAGKSAS